MIGMARVMTPEGIVDLPVYGDNRDLTRDHRNGVISNGGKVIYRGCVCEVMDKFTDEDGDEYTQLMMLDGSQFAGIEFTMHM